MKEQIPLEGVEQSDLADLLAHGLFRRKSDRASGCTRYSDRVVVSPQISRERKGVLPVTVFTLGRFSLLVNGEPADFGRKAPRRSLEMLKVIIAQGGRDISISKLTQLLWPDVDGDRATRSFNTTLHRLRKILGDDRVFVLMDGKVSLDSHYCWVDVWALERLLGGMKHLLRGSVNSHQHYMLENMTETSLALYQDHFLGKEELMNWSVSMRERLRSKFIHCLLEAGMFWERQQSWELAMECYRKGIDIDDLVETFHQRLMFCCLKTLRLSEGMSVYRRCRQTLSIVLSLQPEPETELLYLALKAARRDKKSA